MATYSTNLGFTLIATGDESGTWGTTTNTNLGTLIEQAISGYTTQAVSAGTTTITMPNGTTGVARNMFLELTGTGGGSLEVPAQRKLYFIYNNSSAAITVKVSGQTGVSVPAAAKMSLVCNGTDVVVATNYMAALTLGTALPVASGGTGATSVTAYGAVVGNSGGTGFASVAPGTSGNVLTSNGTSWASTAVAANVSSFSAGTTGLTPSTGTTGAVTLAGTLAVVNGGTGVTTSTGTGATVRAVSPALTTPDLGTPSAGNLANCTGYPAGITLGTTTATTSGTGVTISANITANTRRITILLAGVSTNNVSPLLLRLGTSGGIVSSGYTSAVGDTGANYATSTIGFQTNLGMSAAGIISSTIVLNYAGNDLWLESGTDTGNGNLGAFSISGGSITLASALTQIRLTTVNGIDTFDAGSMTVNCE